MSDKLATWLINELNKRSWSAREMARQINISHTSVSRYLENTLTPSPKVCRRIARVLDVPVEDIMRLAGHLPPLPEPVAHEEEAMALFRALSPSLRPIVLQILRALRPSGITYPLASPPRLAFAQPPPQYPTPDPTIQAQIAPLIEKYPDLGPLFDEAQATLPNHAVRALIYNVEIWIKQEEFRDCFQHLHYRLSTFLANQNPPAS